MGKLSKDAVLKLAHLSRLKLTDSEVERLRGDLSEILDYVRILDNVDTKGLKPTFQLSGLKNVMRQDEIIRYQAKPDDLLKIAPAKNGRYYQSKRVLN